MIARGLIWACIWQASYTYWVSNPIVHPTPTTKSQQPSERAHQGAAARTPAARMPGRFDSCAAPGDAGSFPPTISENLMTETSSQDEARPTEVILADIRKKTRALLKLRKQRDAGKFKSVSAAISLQKVERELAKLRAELPPLKII